MDYIHRKIKTVSENNALKCQLHAYARNEGINLK